MAAAAQAAALEVDVDIVPVVEGVTNGAGRHRVGLAQVVHGGVREHHAPAKGVVGPVALHHRDLVGGVLQLHQQDRKSTRLNSSHLVISYAVFCLKKKSNHSSVLTQLSVSCHA